MGELDVEDEDEADYAWLKAVLAERSEQFQEAVDSIRTAVAKDEEHPHAKPMLVRLTTPIREGRFARLGAYEDLLRTPQFSQHIDSRIGYESLRIELGKEQEQAAAQLRGLLQTSSDTLADIQAARIHQALATVYERNGDDNSALTAHRAALELQPGDVRFALPLARLYLKRYALEKAAQVIGGVQRPDIARSSHAALGGRTPSRRLFGWLKDLRDLG